MTERWGTKEWSQVVAMLTIQLKTLDTISAVEGEDAVRERRKFIQAMYKDARVRFYEVYDQ